MKVNAAPKTEDQTKYSFDQRIKNLKRFSQYFKPHRIMRLFIMDSIFAFLLAAVNVALPFLINLVIVPLFKDNFEKDLVSAILIPMVILIGIIGARLICNWIVTYYGHIMGSYIEINMREQSISKMHKLTMTYYDRTPIGTFVSRQVSNLKDIPEYAHHVPEDLIISFCTLIGALAYCFLLDWGIGIALIAIVILGVFLVTTARKKWRKAANEIRLIDSEMSSSVVKQAEGAAEIKSFASGLFESRLFKTIHERYMRSVRNFFGAEVRMTLSLTLIAGLITILTIIAGPLILRARDNLEISNSLGLVTIAALINEPINRFSAAFIMISRGGTAVSQYYEFMDLPEEKNEGKITNFKLKGQIEFKNVSFAYKNSRGENTQILKNFNLSIKPGEHIAFVGKTGIGKSTILKLLLRFYEVDEGEILYDGKNIHEYELDALRRQLGYIQQSPTIFDASISHNITYGIETPDISAIKTALDVSQVRDFAEKTPEKYQTIVGPRGAMLSGGQKQRVSIARTILHPTPILLLDEATSSLDNETEQKIKAAIDKIRTGKTMIIVAHRLTTIRSVDRIIVLGNGGHILEEGDYKTLQKNKNGHFYNLDNIS